MIIFPDGVDFAAGEATWGTINGTSTWGTQCTSAQWTALEAKGCVFLPAAGYILYRSSTSWTTYNIGSVGNYWSSTGYNAADYAYRLDFYDGFIRPNSGDYRSGGLSVRLVQNK